MQIERIYYPVKSLGYGERLGIWMIGCPRNCHNCSNPELQQADTTKDIDLDKVFKLFRSIEGKVDGVTISGGEPFFQAGELSKLVHFIKHNITEDILVYTGYSLEDLILMGDADIKSILENIAVLIDGEYIDELNDNLPLRGSSNQKIHFLKERYRQPYEELLRKERTVQNIFYGGNLVSIGIPLFNFRSNLIEGFNAKGIRTE